MNMNSKRKAIFNSTHVNIFVFMTYSELELSCPSSAAPSWPTLGQSLRQLMASRWSTNSAVSERWQSSKSPKSSSHATDPQRAAGCRSLLLVSWLLLPPSAVATCQTRWSATSDSRLLHKLDAVINCRSSADTRQDDSPTVHES